MFRRAAIALVVLFLGASAQAEPIKVVSEAPATLGATLRFVVHSDRIGRDFQITVAGPASGPFLPGQKQPVIYALDSGYGIAGPQGQFLGNYGVMEPAGVVSIGYLPGQDDWRMVDLAHKPWTSPLLDGRMTGGGGAAFEAFLLEDLKPWLEAKYAIDPARTVLFGHSAGALFAANVFAHRPDAFAGYIMASVPVWADPDVPTRVAAAAARAKGARVFLSVAEFDDGPNTSDMQPAFKAMTAALSDHPGVLLKTQRYAGENHVSYYSRLVLDSFPFVLPPTWTRTSPQFALPPEVLARYAGAYRLPDGQQITFSATSHGQLSAQVAGGTVVPLLQNGPDRFYAPTSDIDVLFDLRGATLSGGGAKARMEKVGG